MADEVERQLKLAKKPATPIVPIEGEHTLQLTADAVAALRSWEREIEEALADGGQMEITRDWGSKLAGATLRLAALLHCVEHGPSGFIEARTIAAAVEIARYLIPHAHAVLNMMLANEETAAADARYVLRWIDRHNRQEFTKRDAQQHGKRRFKKADDIEVQWRDDTANSHPATEPVLELLGPTAVDMPVKPQEPVVCRRCGSTTWRDVPIHNGKSVRRDCARCGRFIDFPVWKEQAAAGPKDQQPI